MELKLVGAEGAVAASDQAFGKEFNEPLVHQAVTAYLAGGRAGTRAQKNRSDVSGGGAKPWRQKGTGRARAGPIRSPIWRGGGVSFAARPRSYAQKLNKKMYRAAMRSMLSELARQGRLVVAEEMALAEPKTRELLKVLDSYGLDSVLIVTDQVARNLGLASRNLRGVGVCEAAHLDPVSLIRYEQVLMTRAAVRQVEEWLS